MSKRIVLCLSHSIEEAMQLQLLTELGYEVVSIGGYINPSQPHDKKRPALPQVPYFPEIQQAVDALGTPDNLGTAQGNLPDKVLEWLGDDGILVYHHYLDRLYQQWDRIKDWLDGSSRRRVIWRSVGQSVAHNEYQAMPYRKAGLERVAYSPKEANIPGYSGHDALIRFWMDPEEYGGWTGDWTLGSAGQDVDIVVPERGVKPSPFVINITQHLAQRHPYTNYEFWRDATQGLPAIAAGPGSEDIGGIGELPYAAMHQLLRGARAYLYTGTQPASYTLGLIEAGMTGIPIVSIPSSYHSIFPYGPDLFEGYDLVGCVLEPGTPQNARSALKYYLEEPRFRASAIQRERFIEYFGKDVIAKQWKAFLG